MPKITSIKSQVKDKNRVSVYIGGKYRFSLTQRQLLESGLRTGQELSPSDIANYKNESNYGKLLDQALRWLALRAHSEYEIDEYLKRKSSDKKQISKVKNRLIELGGVDDETFAEVWVRNRKLLKPTSKYRIKQELRVKKVLPEIIDQALETEEVDDLASARLAIKSKRRQSRYKDDKKLKQFLARQGYSWDIIKSALELEKSD